MDCKAAGCDFRVKLVFWDNQLYQVHLEAIVQQGDHSCEAEKVLKKKYGQASKILNESWITYPINLLDDRWHRGELQHGTIFFVGQGP